MKKVFSKNNILKGASVLLIAFIMVFSTMSVTATTNEQKNILSKSENIVVNGDYFTPIRSFDTILEEGFEDGVMPPSGGWYLDELNTVNPWVIVDAVTYPDFVHSGDYAGWINYDTPNPSDNWLYTPDLDLTGYDAVTLVFWAECDTNWPTATMELHIQGDGFDDMIWDMIADEMWADFIYREMTFDLSNYIGQTINISWRYVGIDGESFGLDDISVISGSASTPDLECDGTLGWENVDPGSTVTGTFTVENIGDSGSLLDWEIESSPEWGNWTFDPEGGTDLTPEDGAITITVEVVAPDDGEEFIGEVKIVNSENSGDFCIIDATMTDVVSHRSMILQFLEMLAQRFPLISNIFASLL